jgi:hypothetical protein
MKKTLGLMALIGASAMLLTGCSPMTAAEVESKTPAVIYYPTNGDNSAFNSDRQWGFVNSDHEVVKLTCTRDGFLSHTECVDEAGTVLWEPRKHKSTRSGYLTIDGGERTRFRCARNFENTFEGYNPSHLCYTRGW